MHVSGKKKSVAARAQTIHGADLVLEAVAASPHEHRLLLERRRAEANGYEVPLDLEEAAAYTGLSSGGVISRVLDGGMPAHAVACESWIFYSSELKEWLASQCRPQGGDGASPQDSIEGNQA